jgi:hypothetical protein
MGQHVSGHEDWEFARALAGMPELFARLLDQHRAGGDGRCRACTSQVRPAARWPCLIHVAAASAERIAHRRGGEPDEKPGAASPGFFGRRPRDR